MNRDPHNELRCSQFEALLAEALDDADASINTGVGTDQSGDIEGLTKLPRDVRQAFLAHRQDCAVCGPLFAEAQRGMLLLRSLDEAEPPKNLMHNILAATSLAEAPASPTSEGRRAGWLPRFEQWMRPAFSGLLHSRFAASFAMAFFSVSLTLSLAGVNITDVFKTIAHPSTFRRNVVLQYTQAEAKVVSYYENMRVVYEVETRVQQLRKAVAPQNNNNNPNNNPNDTKPDQQNQNRPAPDRRPDQEENYSQQRIGPTQQAKTGPARDAVGVIAASMLPFRGVTL